MITPMKKTGFSLIEIMVSLAIFAMVVVVATGALLTTIDATKKAQSLQTVLTNLNLTLEGMSREIRTGSGYVASGTSFSFDKSGGTRVTYSLDTNNSITRQEGSSGTPYAVTAPEVTVDKLEFTVNGTGTGTQPRVFIFVKGTAGVKEKYKTTFEIQTTVSQRQLNY